MFVLWRNGGRRAPIVNQHPTSVGRPHDIPFVLQPLEPRLLLAAFGDIPSTHDMAADMALATIEVSARIAQASEQGPSPGVFQFTRSGDLSESIDIPYSLGGSATQSTDYVVWEATAHFEPDAATAWVTILPTNDTLLEGTETVELQLLAGEQYTLGEQAAATIEILDPAFPTSQGVFEFNDQVTVDMTFLDAAIASDQLSVAFAFNQSGIGFNNISIYIDADKDPDTGDFRQGYVAGAEYRMDLFVGLGSGDYQLHRLPADQLEDEQFVLAGQVLPVNGAWLVNLPTSAIGSPAAVDLFAQGYRNQPSRVAGNGDRIPDFGWFDTASRQVTLPRPGRTVFATTVDPAGDSSALDLTGGSFISIADQFFIQLEFAQPIDPTNLVQPIVQGAVTLDSDRSLSTGSFELGRPIPTWGGDVELLWQFSGLQPAVLTLNVDSTSFENPEFGTTTNDGRWQTIGNNLFLAASLSAFDTTRVVGDGTVFITPDKTVTPGGTITRIPTDGAMFATASTLESLLNPIVADALPGGGNMIDLTTGRILEPFAWDPQRTQSRTDPFEFGFPSVNPLEITGISTQTIDDHLIIDIEVAQLTQSANGLYEIAMDTDLDALTGKPIHDATQPGNPLLVGAELVILAGSVDFFTVPVWFANLQDGTSTELHEAWVRPHFSPGPNQPGSITVTVPLSELGQLGPSLRFVVSSSQEQGGGQLDVAPVQPITVLLSPTTVVGDLDGNGIVDAFDVDDFEAALADPIAFADAHPGIDPDLVGDVDGNGVLDAFDVDDFESLLAGAISVTQSLDPAEPTPLMRTARPLLATSNAGRMRLPSLRESGRSRSHARPVSDAQWSHIDLLLDQHRPDPQPSVAKSVSILPRRPGLMPFDFGL